LYACSATNRGASAKQSGKSHSLNVT
jgi:hypothetical protein